MNGQPPFKLIVGISILVFLVLNTFYTVPQTTQALVLQFGDPVKEITEPGLNIKIPFIQNVSLYEKRLMNLDLNSEQVILADQKRLLVDTYTRYQITSPLKFYQRLRNEAIARQRVEQLVRSSLRRVLGTKPLADVLSPQREQIIATVQDAVSDSVKEYGLKIADLRIIRADLPKENSQNIFDRMRTEREREAAEFRAQGKEIEKTIMSKADKERTILLAEARKKANILIGQGEAAATKIYATSFNQDPEFYAFVRSMRAYEKALPSDSTTYILSPESDFFKFFGNTSGRKR